MLRTIVGLGIQLNCRHGVNLIRCTPHINTLTRQEHLSDLLNLKQTPDGDNNNDDNNNEQ